MTFWSSKPARRLISRASKNPLETVANISFFRGSLSIHNWSPPKKLNVRSTQNIPQRSLGPTKPRLVRPRSLGWQGDGCLPRKWGEYLEHLHISFFLVIIGKLPSFFDIIFLSQEYSVRTTQLALCKVVCDQLSIPQVYLSIQSQLEYTLVLQGVHCAQRTSMICMHCSHTMTMKTPFIVCSR